MEITEEQKKKVKFKTHTCTIHILGEAKEYTYENVIWLSSNKKWIFYVTKGGHFQIVKIDDIIYGKGTAHSKKEAEQEAAKNALQKSVSE